MSITNVSSISSMAVVGVVPTPTAPIIDSVNGSASSPASGTDSTPAVVVSGIQIGDGLSLYVDGELNATRTVEVVPDTITAFELTEAQHNLTVTTTRYGKTSDASSTFQYTYSSAPEYTTLDYTTNGYGWGGSRDSGGLYGADTYSSTGTSGTDTGYFEGIWHITNASSIGGGDFCGLANSGSVGDIWGNGVGLYFEVGRYTLMVSGAVVSENYADWTGDDTFKVILTGSNAYLYCNDVLKYTYTGTVRTTGYLAYHIDSSGGRVVSLQYKTSP